MTTERLHMAIKNFENMNHMVERYTRLSRSYVSLSERFHQLDVEHMKLKGSMVPLLKALKAYRKRTTELERANLELQQTLTDVDGRHQSAIQNLVATYEEQLESLRSQLEQLQALEWFTTEEAQRELAEAEHQIDLDEETFREIEQDAYPDLSDADKALLVEYHTNPSSFVDALGTEGSLLTLESEQY
ncbi:MAG TPA: hypothetical protein V6D29_21970 [Leptolyngbyaceae cyanobacterium]